ncbi:hypothetical protein AN963_23930 [Brevibacillus choshinensis]|uniref:Transposase DDE domain-containing protein n=1 Tax=Brevibacillus choshinensis TaxID=54911 RepID=A0ABR5N1Z6_BRECH|nr:hypothetical protein AN963_23930 [Brevibacillus choshinensis]
MAGIMDSPFMTNIWMACFVYRMIVVDLYRKRPSLKSGLNGTIATYKKEGAKKLLLFLYRKKIRFCFRRLKRLHRHPYSIPCIHNEKNVAAKSTLLRSFACLMACQLVTIEESTLMEKGD